eukprot:TRINITY_DN4162_c0_g1_i2.p1 TRINITY_DN4162_c0_g1~~TRINITY_DN4162_c0_g1_i2.p1  ORF type:complete len:445 (+),score=86.26 TRINITY_DN4162_c0_g1_i2:140-1474(+)
MAVFPVSVLLCVLLASMSAGQHLHVLYNMSSSVQCPLSSLLGKGVDVRGLHDHFALINAKESTLLHNSPFQDTCASSYVGSLAKNDTILTIFSNEPDTYTWYTQVQSCSSLLKGSWCGFDMCVVHLEQCAEQGVYSCLPASTRFVAMPGHAIQPPSSSHIIRRTTTSAVIETLVSQVSVQQLFEGLVHLTNIYTRQSQSTGAVEAAGFIEATFRKYGLPTRRYAFREGYSDNIVAEIRGRTNPQRIVIVGAHYDCRSETVSSVTNRAPGANDDGTGVAMLFELARILGNPEVRLPYTIQLAAFSGEEQGLFGSYAYADFVKENKADVVAMLQGDMLGYQSVPYLGLDFAVRYTTPDLTDYMDQISHMYVPDLATGTNNGCCSDQRPFFENGYITAKYGHAGGATSDPEYHKTGDVINRPDFSIELVRMITQAMLAGAATLADLQ